MRIQMRRRLSNGAAAAAGGPGSPPESPFAAYAHYAFDEDLPFNRKGPTTAMLASSLIALLLASTLAHPLNPLVAGSLAHGAAYARLGGVLRPLGLGGAHQQAQAQATALRALGALWGAARSRSTAGQGKAGTVAAAAGFGRCLLQAGSFSGSTIATCAAVPRVQYA